jgi:hypothetical protein
LLGRGYIGCANDSEGGVWTRAHRTQQQSAYPAWLNGMCERPDHRSEMAVSDYEWIGDWACEVGLVRSHPDNAAERKFRDEVA